MTFRRRFLLGLLFTALLVLALLGFLMRLGRAPVTA
jgi:hypothetical protein